MRVEGSTSTIFEGPVATDGKTITKAGHTLACDGTSDPSNPTPGPTVTSALDDAAIANGFDWDATFYNDFFFTQIGGVASQTWGYAVNFQPAQVGGCQLQVHAGDEVLFASDFPLMPFERPLSELDSLRLPSDVRERFLSGNARRAFELDRGVT